MALARAAGSGEDLMRVADYMRTEPQDREVFLAKGEDSGMIYCPMKMSRMAVMKCAEYQKLLGCHKGTVPARGAQEGGQSPCPNAATEGQIRLVEARSEHGAGDPSLRSGGARHRLHDPSDLSQWCRRCGRHITPGSKTGFCKSCTPRSRAGHRLITYKTCQCCGEIKSQNYSRHCAHCAQSRRAGIRCGHG